MQLVLVYLHVLGATVWTGGHLVLTLVVLPRALREKDVAAIRTFEAGYERLGIPALAIQIITGFILLLSRVPTGTGDPPLTDLAVGLMVAKIVLLLITTILAAHTRIWIIPNLDQSNLKSLAWHIIPVTVVAVLFVLAGVTFRVAG